MRAGVVQIKQVSQDGMKVRAAAGASSFRTRGKLEQLARQQVETLAREIEDEGGGRSVGSARPKSAHRGEQADQRALEEMDEAEARKRSNTARRRPRREHRPPIRKRA